jgi:HK97 family phage prohead protease
MLVYFIHDKNARAVKIGTTNNLQRRLKEMQTSSPTKLNVLKIIEGAGRVEEIGLHKRFDNYHIMGEWFDLDGELLRYLNIAGDHLYDRSHRKHMHGRSHHGDNHEYNEINFHLEEVLHGEIFTGSIDIFTECKNLVFEHRSLAKTLRERPDRIKFCWNHSEEMGEIYLTETDKKGLNLACKLDISLEKARIALCLIESGCVTKMSLHYDSIKEIREGDVRHLKEIRLWSIALPRSVSDGAQLTFLDKRLL